ncbi:MAG: hypothetical protein ACOC56_00900 [Atribacterota bacterium]
MNNIINKINKLLNEEYLDSEMIKGIYIEFFSNPSKKELTEFKEVRFLIDNLNKKLIVWRSNVLHAPAIRNLENKNLITKDWKKINGGTGRVLKGKIMTDYIHEKVSGKHWADKYFTEPLENSTVWKFE